MHGRSSSYKSGRCLWSSATGDDTHALSFTPLFFVYFFFPLFEMSFVVFCLFHRNIFLLFWYLVFSEKEIPISHITNTLTATCVGSLKRFWSRSPFFFFCSFPFTPPLSSLLFLPPTISVVFSIFSFFIFLSLNSNHLNNESGKTSRGKRCP